MVARSSREPHPVVTGQWFKMKWPSKTKSVVPNERGKTMARKLAFIQSTTAGNVIALDEIPQDVKDEIDATYASIAKSDGRIRAEFDDEAEALLYCKQAASYCAQHRPVWKFRRSPTRNLPPTTVDFRVTADVAENGQAPAKDAKK